MLWYCCLEMDVEKMVGSELITFFFFCCFYLCEFPLVALEGGLLPGKTLRSYNFSLCFEKRFLSTLARFEEAGLARVNTRVKIRCSRSVPLLCTSGSALSIWLGVWVPERRARDPHGGLVAQVSAAGTRSPGCRRGAGTARGQWSRALCAPGPGVTAARRRAASLERRVCRLWSVSLRRRS